MTSTRKNASITTPLLAAAITLIALAIVQAPFSDTPLTGMATHDRTAPRTQLGTADAYGLLSFVDPTPTTGSRINTSSATIVLNISNAPDLTTLHWNWNGNTTTIYDTSLLGSWNFDDTQYDDDFNNSIS